MTFDSRQQPVLPQTLHTMTTSDETAETWRDLADQLTAAQITQLERFELDEPQEWRVSGRSRTPPQRHDSTMLRRPPVRCACSAGSVTATGSAISRAPCDARAGPPSYLRPTASRRLETSVDRRAYQTFRRARRGNGARAGRRADRRGR